MINTHVPHVNVVARGLGLPDYVAVVARGPDPSGGLVPTCTAAAIPVAAAPVATVSRAPAAPAPAGSSVQSLAAGSRPWKVNGKFLGEHVPATQLGDSFWDFDIRSHATLEGKNFRQLGRCKQDPDGNDVSGYIVVSDVAAILLFSDSANASRWANNPTQVNIEIAPSLKYITSGHSHVSERLVYRHFPMDYTHFHVCK